MNYNYILEKLNCARKHIQIVENGTKTKAFATLVEVWDCGGCEYKSFCNQIASVVQRKARLIKSVEK